MAAIKVTRSQWQRLRSERRKVNTSTSDFCLKKVTKKMGKKINKNTVWWIRNANVSLLSRLQSDNSFSRCQRILSSPVNYPLFYYFPFIIFFHDFFQANGKKFILHLRFPITDVYPGYLEFIEIKRKFALQTRNILFSFSLPFFCFGGEGHLLIRETNCEHFSTFWRKIMKLKQSKSQKSPVQVQNLLSPENRRYHIIKIVLKSFFLSKNLKSSNR